MNDLGRALIIIGLVITLAGVALLLAGRVPGLGRLPGDFAIHRGNWTVYVPIGTSIVLSVLLTLILWLVGRR
ncbi:MAG TPA: DUF2905 domain-containing protein [Methylomirabilota bacterium]|nr:DUF2905 domain-containing protein [Methylomirabilota bacterium]